MNSHLLLDPVPPTLKNAKSKKKKGSTRGFLRQRHWLCKPGELSLISRSYFGKREPNPKRCPLNSTYTAWHVPHTMVINNLKEWHKKKSQNLLKVPKKKNQVDKREKGWRVSGGAWEHDVKLMKRNWLTKLCTSESVRKRALNTYCVSRHGVKCSSMAGQPLWSQILQVSQEDWLLDWS